MPIAFNPNTGLIYMSTWNLPRIQKLAPPKPQVLGADSTGVIGRPAPIKPGDVVGHFVAINPLTGEKKWEVPLTDLPSSAGMLVTDGGLVFTGKLTGEFVALDIDTGKTLWQFKTGSSVNSTAITYTHKGQQYVSIASGLGGSVARRLAVDKVPTGGSVWTFALMPRIDRGGLSNDEAWHDLRPRPRAGLARALRPSNSRRSRSSRGAEVYATYCVTCHGWQMDYPGGSFDLRTFPSGQFERFANSVIKGKNNMPPWGEVLQPGDIEALWAYVMAGERK